MPRVGRRGSAAIRLLIWRTSEAGCVYVGHPSIQIALPRGLALERDGAGAVAQLNRIADLGLSFAASNGAACQRPLNDDPAFAAGARRLAESGEGTGRGNRMIKLGPAVADLHPAAGRRILLSNGRETSELLLGHHLLAQGVII